LRGELGGLAGQQLAESAAQPIVGDIESAEDLRGDTILARAEGEQDVHGRGDTAAVSEAARFAACRFQNTLGPRRAAQPGGFAGVTEPDD